MPGTRCPAMNSDWVMTAYLAELLSNIFILPAGWLEVTSGADTYFWNPYTDQTTWAKPETPAENDVGEAAAIFERCLDHDDALAATTISISPREDSAEPSEMSARATDARRVTWPPTPPGSADALPALVPNAVLTRVGAPSCPPPQPVSIAGKMRAFQLSRSTEFDDALWQWLAAERACVHLRPPPRPKRELFTVRSKSTPFVIPSSTFGITGARRC